MTKLSLALLPVLLILAFDTTADIYRNKNGIQIGSSATDSSGNIIYRDKNGIQTGSATTDSSGRTTYRDKNGIKIGSKQ
ncbi:hypothetical protein [Yersinia intermedia]|uniref:hypothetical protein n=1 Tax=Yersinia intermedia TaxID=631 RepID=UPI0039C62BA8